MITRRSVVLTGAAALLAGLPQSAALAAPPAAIDPLAIVNAIYARAASGKGDGGGGFVTNSKATRAKNLSKSLAALWIRCPYPEGRCRPGGFRSGHQLAGAGRQILRGGCREVGPEHGDHRSDHHRQQRAARQRGGRRDPL